jgi:hypothetical protein
MSGNVRRVKCASKNIFQLDSGGVKLLCWYLVSPR